MAVQQRMQRELEEMARSPPSLCSAGPLRGNLLSWTATITGPPISPYQGGLFKLAIDFPVNYPSNPPKVKFVTKIYHMNINDQGYICLDILSHQWKPEITLSKVLLAICNLLTHPNPDDPLNREKCEIYKRDRITYSKNAQQWTAQYAMN